MSDSTTAEAAAVCIAPPRRIAGGVMTVVFVSNDLQQTREADAVDDIVDVQPVHQREVLAARS